MKRFLKRLLTFFLSLFFIASVGLCLYLSAFKEKSEPSANLDTVKEGQNYKSADSFEIIFENSPNSENKTVSNEITPKSDFLFDAETGTITGYVGSDTAVSIPSFIDGKAVKHIGSNAFSSSTLSSITISEGILDIASNAFKDCHKLTDVFLSSSVKSLGISAFDGCTALEKITLSANLQSIGDYCFYKCSSLKSITFPSTLTAMGNRAFAENTLLEKAYFKGNAPKNWGTDVFLNTEANFTLYYLSESTGFTASTYRGYQSVCIYHIDTEETAGSIVTLNSKRAAAGSSVTFTMTPDSSKRIISAYYKDIIGKHEIADSAFIMPNSDVTIGAILGWNALYVSLTLFIVLCILGFILRLLFRQTNKQ